MMTMTTTKMIIHYISRAAHTLSSHAPLPFHVNPPHFPRSPIPNRLALHSYVAGATPVNVAAFTGRNTAQPHLVPLKFALNAA